MDVEHEFISEFTSEDSDWANTGTSLPDGDLYEVIQTRVYQTFDNLGNVVKTIFVHTYRQL